MDQVRNRVKSSAVPSWSTAPVRRIKLAAPVKGLNKPVPARSGQLNLTTKPRRPTLPVAGPIASSSGSTAECLYDRLVIKRSSPLILSKKRKLDLEDSPPTPVKKTSTVKSSTWAAWPVETKAPGRPSALQAPGPIKVSTKTIVRPATFPPVKAAVSVAPKLGTKFGAVTKLAPYIPPRTNHR